MVRKSKVIGKVIKIYYIGKCIKKIEIYKLGFIGDNMVICLD